jgi:hypothetical protein
LFEIVSDRQIVRNNPDKLRYGDQHRAAEGIGAFRASKRQTVKLLGPSEMTFNI